MLHHWHKHKSTSLIEVEHELRKHCAVIDCSRRVYEFEDPQTHVLLFSVILPMLTSCPEAPEGGVQTNCSLIVNAAASVLRLECAQLIGAVRKNNLSDLHVLSCSDDTVADALSQICGLLTCFGNKDTTQKRPRNPSNTQSGKPTPPAKKRCVVQPRTPPVSPPTETADCCAGDNQVLDTMLGSLATPPKRTSETSEAASTPGSPVSSSLLLSPSDCDSDLSPCDQLSCDHVNANKPVITGSSTADLPCDGMEPERKRRCMAEETDMGVDGLVPEPVDTRGTGPEKNASADQGRDEGGTRSGSAWARATPQHDDKPRPFVNLGASCYINATLTALFGIQTFRETLKNIYDAHAQRLERVLWPAATSHRVRVLEVTDARTTNEERLAVTFRACFEPQAGTGVVPVLFTNRFYNRQQEDAHEFLLRSIANEESAPMLSAALSGVDAPQLACSRCGWQRPAAIERFNHMSVQICRMDGSPVHSVQQAMDMYLQPETIHLRDWICENNHCVLSRAGDCSPNKVHSITTPPRVLIVQLVHWKNEANRRICLFHAVTPEMVLDVSGVQYDLKAIVCHIGPDASHGHYTARIHFPAAGGNWWYYNNTARRLAGDEELETTAAERSYILMYEQRFATAVLEVTKKTKNKIFKR